MGAALGVLLLAATCAGSGPPPSRFPARGDVLRAAGLRASAQLVVGRTRRSDLVGLWQSVLWADGYSDRSGVTCSYDRAVAAVTQVWQSNHRLAPDGIVGPATWGAALARLVPVGRWTVYQGERHDLPLWVDRGGAYEVDDEGAFHRLYTDTVTLALCR
ncbi:Putative peptidoglycan binding domain-containing protein [Streptomyces sp. DvalAA-14]|nr:Putative peptidoglycan binding domain-containing protein [Streptomyces sp. DvalAA-14]